MPSSSVVLPSEPAAGPRIPPAAVVEPTRSSADAPRNATATAATAPSADRWWRRHFYGLSLAALTLFGAALRLIWLDRPPIWCDESATFNRIRDSWTHLFNSLETAGFLPLHYIIHWWIGQRTPLTPFMLRIVPTVAGIAMIPTMYFLARQMATRRVALLAAAITAGSAYLHIFSRDGKMYMHSWLFIALSVALLLWWTRSRRWWVWLLGIPLWLAAANASVWLNANALIVLGLAPLLVLLQLARPWWRIALVVVIVLAGTVGTAYGPYVYYRDYNKWHQRSGGVFQGQMLVDPDAESELRWTHTGIDWLARFHAERTGWQMARHSAGVFLTGWEWPNRTELTEKADDGSYVIPRWTYHVMTTALGVLAAACLVALLPWPRRWRGSGDPTNDPPPQPWWRTTLWLGFWMGLPAYGFYCRSVEPFASPGDWLAMAWSLWGWWWLVILAGSSLLALALTRAARLLSWAAGLCLATLALVTLGPAIMLGGWDWFSHWIDQLAHPLVLTPVCVVVPALMWHGAGHSPRTRAITFLQGAIVLIVMIILLWVVHGVFAGLYQRAMDREDLTWRPVWWPRYVAVIWPALVIGLSILLLRLPTWPLRAALIGLLLAVNVTTAMARLVLPVDAPYEAVAGDLYRAAHQDEVAILGYRYRYDQPEPRPWRPESMERRAEVVYYYELAAITDPEAPEPRTNAYKERIARTANMRPDRLAGWARRQTAVTRLILWEHHPAMQSPPAETDALWLVRLGPGWRVESIDTRRWIQHHSRMSREWNWQHREWMRRIEFVRDAPLGEQGPPPAGKVEDGDAEPDPAE